MTTAEVARYLNFEVRTIMRFTKLRVIPFRKVHGRLRFDPQQIHWWLTHLPGVAAEEAVNGLRALVPKVNRSLYEGPNDAEEKDADGGDPSRKRSIIDARRSG
jgi:excisionase family DNA binding protein